MITVPATEFSKNFGRYREIAQAEPVAVTSHDRVSGVFLSSADYQEYMKLRAQKSQALAVEELPPAMAKAIASAVMDKRHRPLNHLLKK